MIQKKQNHSKAKIKTKEIQSKLIDLKQNFKTQLSVLQNDINNAHQTYKLIKDSIIPLKQEIQTNIESYNSYSQITPQDSIKNLNDLISYEMMLLDEINKYFSGYGQSIYFTQGSL